MKAFRKTIVLDSNLIVSSILNPEGICTSAIEIAGSNFDMISSKETIGELITVLQRDKFDKYASKENRAVRLGVYIEATRMVDVGVSITECLDPKDNKFLELAVAGGASIIVSGDKKHLVSMSPFRGVEIIRVRDFVENYIEYL
jgi:putative PIN family toxin of toxin-antitoxin system